MLISTLLKPTFTHNVLCKVFFSYSSKAGDGGETMETEVVTINSDDDGEFEGKCIALQ